MVEKWMKVDAPAPGIPGDYFRYCHGFGASMIMTKPLQESHLRELQENKCVHPWERQDAKIVLDEAIQTSQYRGWCYILCINSTNFEDGAAMINDVF